MKLYQGIAKCTCEAEAGFVTYCQTRSKKERKFL